ncbi:MAG: PaaX-like protein [Ilumatobacteraceae bacterium]|nr:PaaX-like protein [Ilumatobacteraceae bacterium]
MTSAGGEAVPWVVMIPRIPSEPSRYRVAVWRELRRSGAVQLGQGTWALPQSPSTGDELDKLRTLIGPSGGDMLVLGARAWTDDDHDRLQLLFDEARRAEWAEFTSECDKALDELRGEIAKQKFTLAELDEEEQNVERLRRWHRELAVRDRFAAVDRATMQAQFDACAAELARFTELVYAAVGFD